MSATTISLILQAVTLLTVFYFLFHLLRQQGRILLRSSRAFLSMEGTDLSMERKSLAYRPWHHGAAVRGLMYCKFSYRS